MNGQLGSHPSCSSGSPAMKVVEQDGEGASFLFFPSFLPQCKDLDMFLVLWEGACGERWKKRSKREIWKWVERQDPDGGLPLEIGEHRQGQRYRKRWLSRWPNPIPQTLCDLILLPVELSTH